MAARNSRSTVQKQSVPAGDEAGRQVGRGGRVEMCCGGGFGCGAGIRHSDARQRKRWAEKGDRIRVTMRRIYFDNNATTPLLSEVFEAMKPYLLESFGNASSVHGQGQQAR